MNISILTKLSISILAIVLFFSCGNSDLGDSRSNQCIDDYWSDNVLFKSLISFEHEGETIYSFVPDCCDQYSEYYDSACNYICSIGGIQGGGDGLCPDWKATEEDLILIYQR